MTPVSYSLGVLPAASLGLRGWNAQAEGREAVHRNMISEEHFMAPSKSSVSAVTVPAARFVDARLRAGALSAFPGALPEGLEQAYAIQDVAIDLWPDKIGGWKVGFIAPEWQRQSGIERIVGPIFRDHIQRASAGKVAELAVFDGGFSAAEAELVFRIGRNADKERMRWNPEEAQELVDAMHIGVENAGSPLASVNELGPLVTISDFGNNAGLIVGPAIESWSTARLQTLAAKMIIDGVTVGCGTAADIQGGPLTALAFALELCARRGRPLLAGQWVSTGAVTGVHRIRPGQEICADFGALGRIQCRAVKAEPHNIAMRKQA